jgi:hypothetical protein
MQIKQSAMFSLIAFGLASCATATAIDWSRIDGTPIKGNAALERQFTADEAVCQGEMAKTDAVSVAPMSRRFQADEAVYKGCMSGRGYVEVGSSVK